MKSKITQALVERGPTPERGKSVLHADTEMRGLYLIVTPTKRSFYVQSLVNGKQVRTKLGDHPSMDAKQARDLARKTLVEMRGGANLNEERRKAKARGITLRDALDLHLAAKPLSPRTKEDYRYCCDQYLPDWLARIFHRSRATNEYGIALVCPKIQVSNLDQRAGNAEAKLYRRN